MNLNHQLNPIYTPQGVSVAALLHAAANHINTGHHAHDSTSKLSDKQLNHNIRLHQLAAEAVRKLVDTNYKAAFNGVSAASEIIERLPLNKKTGKLVTRAGVLRQLRKYQSLGIVQQEQGRRNRERLWSWVK